MSSWVKCPTRFLRVVSAYHPVTTDMAWWYWPRICFPILGHDMRWHESTTHWDRSACLSHNTWYYTSLKSRNDTWKIHRLSIWSWCTKPSFFFFCAVSQFTGWFSAHISYSWLYLHRLFPMKYRWTCGKTHGKTLGKTHEKPWLVGNHHFLLVNHSYYPIHIQLNHNFLLVNHSITV